MIISPFLYLSEGLKLLLSIAFDSFPINLYAILSVDGDDDNSMSKCDVENPDKSKFRIEKILERMGFS